MMTNQDDPKSILPPIPTGSPVNDALYGSPRRMRNDADPQIRRLIDDTFAGKRTTYDLTAAEWSGGRVREACPNLEAIRKEVERLGKELGTADRTTEKSE